MFYRGGVFLAVACKPTIIYESCFSIAAPPFATSTLIVRLSFGGRNGGTTRRRMKTEIMLPSVRKTDPNDSDRVVTNGAWRVGGGSVSVRNGEA